MNNRKLQLKLYGHLYKRVSDLDWEKCVYCDEPMNVYDHCPPITIVENLNIKQYKKKGNKFRLYPSCSQCNRLLSAFPSTDIYERLDYLIRKYEIRLDKIEVWSKSELEQMGYAMRNHILNNQSSFEILNNKVTALVEHYCSDDYIHLL